MKKHVTQRAIAFELTRRLTVFSFQTMNAASTITLSMPARDCDMIKARLMKAMPAKNVSLPITPRSNT